MYIYIMGVDFSSDSPICWFNFGAFLQCIFLFLLDLRYYHIQFVAHVEMINILNPLSSSGRQTEEGKYRIETEEDVCYL